MPSYADKGYERSYPYQSQILLFPVSVIFSVLITTRSTNSSLGSDDNRMVFTRDSP